MNELDLISIFMKVIFTIWAIIGYGFIRVARISSVSSSVIDKVYSSDNPLGYSKLLDISKAYSYRTVFSLTKWKESDIYPDLADFLENYDEQG